MSERGASPVARSFVFKLAESFGVQLIGFAVSLVLARKLDLADYGVVTMLSIFIAISQVFVQSGLNVALIQKKEISDTDSSSVFYLSLFVAAAMYALLYLLAPAIGGFYSMPELVRVMRVLALTLLPGSLVSVQQAIASREMRFKRLMISALIATVISGTVGIAMAYSGSGYWALVWQQLTNQISLAAILLVAVRWRPRLVFSFESIRTLISFGWKLLVSSLIDTLYNNLRGLVIGKRYNADTLGVYDRGRKYPELVMNVVNGSIQSVMLPVLSREQENAEGLKNKMRRSIIVSSYLVFPLMAGMIAAASPLITVLMTEKWLPCVPFLQICCVDFAFYPIHTANLQAINAMGRSDMYLRLELIKKGYGILILVLTVLFFKSAFAIAAGGAVSTLISAYVNAYPNKKLLGYGYAKQLRDVLPSIIMALVMAAAVSLITLFSLNAFLTLALQVVAGAVVYAGLSLIFKPKGFTGMAAAVGALLKRG